MQVPLSDSLGKLMINGLYVCLSDAISSARVRGGFKHLPDRISFVSLNKRVNKPTAEEKKKYHSPGLRVIGS